MDKEKIDMETLEKMEDEEVANKERIEWDIDNLKKTKKIKPKLFVRRIKVIRNKEEKK